MGIRRARATAPRECTILIYFYYDFIRTGGFAELDWIMMQTLCDCDYVATRSYLAGWTIYKRLMPERPDNPFALLLSSSFSLLAHNGFRCLRRSPRFRDRCLRSG